MAALDLNKRLKRIKSPILLQICAPISELQSNISTMVQTDPKLCANLWWTGKKIQTSDICEEINALELWKAGFLTNNLEPKIIQ